ncbi:MAG: cupin domain-containing protein [Patescibacteria group bacterium]
MVDIENVKTRLLRDGYTVIHEYDDRAGEEFPDHTHDTNQILIVIRGDLVIHMDGSDSTLKPGDELFFPPQKVHAVKIGPDGCFYLVGEKS